MRVAFVDARHCWAQLHLFRAAQDRPFDDEDARLMRQIDQPVAAALRHAMARPMGPDSGVDFAVGVMMIDQSLRATAQTPATGQWLEYLQPAAVPYGTTVPASLFQLAARVRYAGHPPVNARAGAAYRVRLRAADGGWVLEHVSGRGPTQRHDHGARGVVQRLALGHGSRHSIEFSRERRMR